MTYKEKAAKFKDMVYKENAGDLLKWKNRKEFSEYLENWGGRMKEDLVRRRGYLVAFIQNSTDKHPRIVAEVPMDFAMKVLSMGGFP